MTLTTLEGACETLKPIEYADDFGLETVENQLDTPETVVQIIKYNAALAKLCPQAAPINLNEYRG